MLNDVSVFALISYKYNLIDFIYELYTKQLSLNRCLYSTETKQITLDSLHLKTWWWYFFIDLYVNWIELNKLIDVNHISLMKT